jgi:hypothetical protein
LDTVGGFIFKPLPKAAIARKLPDGFELNALGSASQRFANSILLQEPLHLL